MHAILLTLALAMPLGDMDPAGVDEYVQQLQREHPTFEQRLTAVVHQSLGTAYADGPLGEGPDGAYDSDPLIDLARVDCVTFMEQSIALAVGTTYDEAFDRLQQIRYVDGVIDYEHRNHFFVTDWLANNPFCIEITGDLGAPTKQITRTISRKGFFERVNAPELGHTTADVSETLTIVPSKHVDDAEAAISSPAIVVFVGKVDWLFALHTGLFIPDADGGGTLYHASSKSGEVVAADLSDYVAEQRGRYLGIAVYRVTAPVQNPQEGY